MAEKKYSPMVGHEPLRVPAGWNDQSRSLVGQMERLMDDVYQKLQYTVSSREQKLTDGQQEQVRKNIHAALETKSDLVLNADNVTSDTFILGLPNGYYTVYATGNTTVVPYLPTNHGTLLVLQTGDIFRAYIFIDIGCDIYIRHKSGGQTWESSWTRCLLERDIHALGTPDMLLDVLEVTSGSGSKTTPLPGWYRIRLAVTSGSCSLQVNGITLFSLDQPGEYNAVIPIKPGVTLVGNVSGTATVAVYRLRNA